MNLLSNLSNTMMIYTMRTQFAFLLILLGAVGSSSGLHAQAVTGGPGQPEFSSFEPISSGHQVDPYTGNFSYSIPLVTLPGPNGNYGMSLFYHGGIGMDQVASWAGLGWNLNAGAINRSVVAVPDDWRGKKRYLMSYDADTVTFERIGIASQSIPKTSLSLGLTMDRVNGEFSGFSGKIGYGPAAFTAAAGTGGDTHFSLFGLKAYLGDGPSNTEPTTLPPYIYQRSRTKWWTRMSKVYSKTEYYTTVAMNQYHYNYGLLYSDEGYHYTVQNEEKVLDSYSNPYDRESGLGEEHNSLTGVGYDEYVVSGEGIGGSFTANLWEEGNLPRQGAVIDYGTGQELRFMNQDPVTNGRDKIHFTFSGQRFSSPQLPAGSWDIAPPAGARLCLVSLHPGL